MVRMNQGTQRYGLSRMDAPVQTCSPAELKRGFGEPNGLTRALHPVIARDLRGFTFLADSGSTAGTFFANSIRFRPVALAR